MRKSTEFVKNALAFFGVFQDVFGIFLALF